MAGLGTVYAIPQTNTSAIIPSATFYPNVPIEQISYDAFNSVWPVAFQAAASAAPQLAVAALPGIQQIAPAVVDAAWPRVMQRVPEAIAVIRPYVSQMVSDVVPEVWTALKPQISAEIATMVAAEEKKAALVGGLLAVGALVGSVFLAQKMGWVKLPRIS